MKSKKDIQEKIVKAVNDVRKNNPMAPSITNSITINFVANAQIAVGGSAAMVYLPDEAEVLAKLGGAFYINMGGILPIYAETLPIVARILHENKIPWVLDPVAIGIGILRKNFLLQFKEFKPDIIRGNASEIIALAGLWNLEKENLSNVRGVDSVDEVLSARSSAIALAKYTGGAVSVSGNIDLVTDGSTVIVSNGGSEFMEKITGAGCSLGGVNAIYATVTDPFTAAITSTQIYNIAGARAEKISNGPGSFQVNFLDELYNVSAKDVSNNPFYIEEV